MKRNWMAAALLTSVLGLAGGVRADSTRVLVVPFTALNVMDSQQWISRGIQESIVADWGKSNQFSPIAYQGQLIVEDNATAARLARQASAPLVVRGAVQVIGPNARLTAQVIDARTGDTLNTATVTGAVTDLLKLEDELSAQLRGSNTSTPAGPGAAPYAAGSTTGASQPAGTQTGGSGTANPGSTGNQPIVIQSPPPQVIVIGNTGGQSYPSYPSYGYGDYYGYPYSPVPGFSYTGWPGYIPGYYGGVFFTSSNCGFNNNRHCSQPCPQPCQQPGFGTQLVSSTGPSAGPLNIANVNNNLTMTPINTGGNLSMVPIPTGPFAPVQFNSPAASVSAPAAAPRASAARAAAMRSAPAISAPARNAHARSAPMAAPHATAVAARKASL